MRFFSAVSSALREHFYVISGSATGGSGSPLTIRVIPAFIRGNPKFKTIWV